MRRLTARHLSELSHKTNVNPNYLQLRLWVTAFQTPNAAFCVTNTEGIQEPKDKEDTGNN
jgi:hypothetical protein